MAAITIRNLPDEVHRALKARAQRHGRSTEAEVRDILEKAVAPFEAAGCPWINPWTLKGQGLR